MLSGGPLVGEPVAVGPGSSAPSNFVWKYCRMCALEVRQGVYIFGEEVRRLQIPEKIRKTVTILVLEEDTLPKKICTNCCTNLEAYTQFKDSVVDAQEKLTSIARSIEKSQEQSLIQLRSRQYLKSPKRPKLYNSSTHTITPPSALVPAPSFLCADNDLGDPSIECDDEPPSSVVSSEDEEPSTNNAKVVVVVPECSSAVEVVASKDDDVQEPVQGSPPFKLPSSSTTLSPPEVNNPSSSQTDHQADNGVVENVSLNSVGTIEFDDEEEETVEDEAHLVCGICSVRMSDRDLLILHYTKHHDLKSNNNKDPVFRCSACSRISTNYDAIRQHIYRHRMLGAHKCTDCDKSYSTKDQLNVHISSKHNPSGPKAFLCNSCGKQESVSSKQIIGSSPPSSKPSTSVSVPAASSPSNSEQQCNQSSSSSSSSTLQNKSTDLSSVGSSQQQPGCSKDARNQQDINPTTTETNKDGKDSYWKCDQCEKILYSKHGYETHVAVHKGHRVTCEYCGASYTQRSTLEHHIKVKHTNAEKEFECLECKKYFKTLRQLGWHMNTHEKPLSDVICPQCEKKFSNTISLKTHMKLHKGSKNFPCPECPKSFYTKQKLDEHNNSHTGRRPYGCPTENCTKVFSCFSNYAEHFKKHHYELLGPRGSMIPPSKMIEPNNNIDACNSNNSVEILKIPDHQQAPQALTVPSTTTTTTTTRGDVTGGAASFSPSKSQPLATTSNSYAQPQATISTSTSNVVPSPLGTTTIASSSINQQTPMALSIKPTVLIYPNASNSNVCNQSVQTSSLSSTTAATQVHGGCLPLVVSNNSPGQGHTLTLHASNLAINDVPSHQSSSQQHQQHQSVVAAHGGSSTGNGQTQTTHQAHHHNNSTNINNSHNAHTHQPPPHHSIVQNHQHISQLPHNPVQTVWTPMIITGSKGHYLGKSSSFSSTMDALMDCTGSIAAHHSDSIPGANNNNNHSHGHHPGNFNVMHAAHHSVPSHPPPHLQHSVASSSSHNHHSLHPSHHSVNSHPSNSLPSNHNHHNIGSTSSGNTVTVPTFVPSSQQIEPMELSYKIDSNNFQDMPMELTKVFTTQRDPLELCVNRSDLSPGMDLSVVNSRGVTQVTVGSNPPINVSSLSMMNGSSNPNSYATLSSGGSSTATLFHKIPVEMIDRELLNDFTGAFRPPIDLIARPDDQHHELCSEGSLVDLSLRTSFGSDHATSSLLQNMMDRTTSDAFHGENLTNKPHHPHSQPLHHHSHSSVAHHSKGGNNNNSSSHQHHHHHSSSSHHNNDHHHRPPPESSHNQSSSSTVVLQMYQDGMFSLQN